LPSGGAAQVKEKLEIVHRRSVGVVSIDLGSATGPLLGWIGIEIAQSHLVFWVGGGLLLLGALLAAVEPATRGAADAARL